MALIPLGIGAYKRADGFVPEVLLRNMYLEADKSGISPDKTLRITRPGLSLVYTLSPVIRGIDYRTAKDQRLIVAGSTLTSNGADVGTLPGAGIAPMANTAFIEAIVADGRAFLYDTALTEVPIPNDPFTDEPQFAQDVDQLNNYILILLTNG